MRESVSAGKAEERGTGKLRFAVALLIAAASVSSALIGWRASEYSGRASDLDQRGLEETRERQQILAGLEAFVVGDLRLLGSYQEHVKASVVLERRASRAANRSVANALDARAREEEDAAESIRRSFLSQQKGILVEEKNGDVRYDRARAFEALKAEDIALPDLHPDEAFASARVTREQAVNLVGIAALVVASLIFFTLARFGRAGTNSLFAGTGGLLLVTGLTLFVWIGP